MPCMIREQSSGKYLIRTLLLRYFRKPYRGLVSSYSATALRTSIMPPLPRLSTCISSRPSYFNKNLFDRQVSFFLSTQREPSRASAIALLRIPTEKGLVTYQPPGSEVAASCASTTMESSSPFNDMVLVVFHRTAPDVTDSCFITIR